MQDAESVNFQFQFCQYCMQDTESQASQFCGAEVTHKLRIHGVLTLSGRQYWRPLFLKLPCPMESTGRAPSVSKTACVGESSTDDLNGVRTLDTPVPSSIGTISVDFHSQTRPIAH